MLYPGSVAPLANFKDMKGVSVRIWLPHRWYGGLSDVFSSVESHEYLSSSSPSSLTSFSKTSSSSSTYIICHISMDIMDIKPNILSHIKININLFVSRRARAESIRHLHCKPHHTFVPSAWGVDYQHVSIKKQSCQYFYKQWIMKTIFTIIRISNSEMPKCLCYCASTHQKYACKYKFVFTQIQIMDTTYFPSVPMYVQALAFLEVVPANQNLCIWLTNIWGKQVHNGCEG